MAGEPSRKIYSATPVLGRMHMELGSLYDMINDQPIGRKLWADSYVQDHIINWDATITEDGNSTFLGPHNHPAPPGGVVNAHAANARTHSEMVASESFDDKAKSLQISAQLKMSCLGGLLELDGGAKYLKNTKSRSKVQRATFHYEKGTTYTTLSEDIYNDRSQMRQQHFGGDSTATHVVVAVKFGGSANFIFEKTVGNRDDAVNFHGDFHAKCSMLPSFSVEGEAEVDYGDEDSSYFSDIKCTLATDIPVNDVPTSFEDAVKLIKRLPRLMGSGTPQTVILYPLVLLDDKANKLMREIHDRAIDRTVKLMEMLWSTGNEADEMLEHPSMRMFPRIERRVNRFKNLLDRFVGLVSKRLQQILPKIRAGDGNSEQELFQVLDDIDQSPFSPRRLREWMDRTQELCLTAQAFYESVEQHEHLTPVDNFARISAAMARQNTKDLFILAIKTGDHIPEPGLDHLERNLNNQEQRLDFDKQKCTKVASGEENGSNTSDRVTSSPQCASSKSTHHSEPAIVLIGLTGDGKSNLACSLAGAPAFEVGHTKASQTHVPKLMGHNNTLHWFGDTDRQRLVLLDTPGMDDTQGRDSELLRKTVNCLQDEAGVVRAFVLVCNSQVPRVSPSKRLAIKTYRSSLGPRFWAHFVLVLTRWTWQVDDEDSDDEDGKSMEDLQQERRDFISTFRDIEREVSASEDAFPLIDEVAIFGIDIGRSMSMGRGLAPKGIPMAALMNHRNIAAQPEKYQSILTGEKIDRIRKLSENGRRQKTLAQLEELYTHISVTLAHRGFISTSSFEPDYERPNISGYTNQTQTVMQGEEIPCMLPLNTRGPPRTFVLHESSPPLPPGISLDVTSGEIRGTPTEPSPQMTYMLVAKNTVGISNPVSFTLTVSEAQAELGPDAFQMPLGATRASLDCVVGYQRLNGVAQKEFLIVDHLSFEEQMTSNFKRIDQTQIIYLHNGRTPAPGNPSSWDFALPGEPRDLRGAPQSTSEVSLTWAAPQFACSPPIDGYIVSHKVMGTGEWTETTCDNVTGLTVGGLTTGTNYAFRICAKSPSGLPGGHRGPWTEHITTATWQVTGVPTLQVTTRTTSTIKLAWVAPEGDHPTPSGYDIERQGSGVAVLGNVVEHAFNSLSPATTYQFRVRAKSSAGVGEWSGWVKGRTEGSPPGIPQLHVVRTSTDSVTVRWDAPGGANPPISGYDLDRKDSGETRLGNVAEHSFCLLRSCTRYQIRVRAKSAAGMGTWSNWVTVMTEAVPIPKPPAPSSVLANGNYRLHIAEDGHYGQRSWTLVAHRCYGMDKRDSGSTFASVHRNWSASNSVWRITDVGKGTYELAIAKDSHYGQEGWKLGAHRWYGKEKRDSGSTYASIHRNSNASNTKWRITVVGNGVYELAIAQDGHYGQDGWKLGAHRCYGQDKRDSASTVASIHKNSKASNTKWRIVLASEENY